MSDSRAFERAAEELENRTRLNRLEARGTLRIALKSIGLDGRSATKVQVATVVEKMLVEEVAARGIENASEVCTQVVAALADLEDSGSGDSALDVFERLGNSQNA